MISGVFLFLDSFSFLAFPPFPDFSRFSLFFLFQPLDRLDYGTFSSSSNRNDEKSKDFLHPERDSESRKTEDSFRPVLTGNGILPV